MTNQAPMTWMWLALFRLIVTLTVGWLMLETIQMKFIRLASFISGF